MKNTLLFSTLIVGLALAGCNKSTKTSTAANRDYSTATPTADQIAADTRAATDRMASDVRNGVNNAANAVSNAAHDFANSARMTEWRLNGVDIQADVDANRAIVRTNSTAGAPTGKVDKSQLQKAVESRLSADGMANSKIQVDPGMNGEINLDGEANSAADIGHAIALALDTPGVTKVTSKIKVDKKAEATRQ